MITIEQAIQTADQNEPDKRLEEFGVDVDKLIEQSAAASGEIIVESKGDLRALLLNCMGLFMAGASIGFELGRASVGSDQ